MDCGPTGQTCNQQCDYSQNPSCTITANQNDIIEIYGQGFSLGGGNVVNLTGSGGNWYFYQGDGDYYWDASHTQINAQVACYLPPGSWTFTVTNPSSGIPSTGYPLNVVSSSSCQ